MLVFEKKQKEGDYRTVREKAFDDVLIESPDVFAMVFEPLE